MASVLIAAVFCTGCTNETGRPKPDIAISMASFQIQRWAHEASMITRLANDKGLSVITTTANNDVNLQKKQLAQFINQQIPVIIVVAADGKALDHS